MGLVAQEFSNNCTLINDTNLPVSDLGATSHSITNAMISPRIGQNQISMQFRLQIVQSCSQK